MRTVELGIGCAEAAAQQEGWEEGAQRRAPLHGSAHATSFSRDTRGPRGHQNGMQNTACI